MVLRALAEGRIDRARAEIFAAELAALSDVAAAKIANALCDIAGSMTSRRLRYALRRMVLAVDRPLLAAGRRRPGRMRAWKRGPRARATPRWPAANSLPQTRSPRTAGSQPSRKL